MFIISKLGKENIKGASGMWIWINIAAIIILFIVVEETVQYFFYRRILKSEEEKKNTSDLEIVEQTGQDSIEANK